MPCNCDGFENYDQQERDVKAVNLQLCRAQQIIYRLSKHIQDLPADLQSKVQGEIAMLREHKLADYKDQLNLAYNKTWVSIERIKAVGGIVPQPLLEQLSTLSNNLLYVPTDEELMGQG